MAERKHKGLPWLFPKHCQGRRLFPYDMYVRLDSMLRRLTNTVTGKYCPRQFCWECLADYDLVRDQGQEGHNPGCYFRDNPVSPMRLRGSTLEEALQDD